MAHTLNLSDFALVDKEATELSQVIFQKQIETGTINMYHQVVTEIQSGEDIPLLGVLGLVGECISGCAIPTGANIPMSKEKWNPKNIEFQLENCSADLNQLFRLAKKKMKMYEDQYDWKGSVEETIVLMRVEEALPKVLFRHIHFGDTAIANVDDDGTLLDGTDVKYFNCIDGLWKQVFSKTILAAGGLRHVAITENAEATYVDQLDLGATKAFTTLQAMVTKADARLKQASNKVIMITRTLADNLLNNAENQSIANALDFRKTMADQAKQGDFLTIGEYRGIPVYVMDSWDETIQTYLNNGTKYDKPHRALLTTTDNIPVGTPSADCLGSLTSWYNIDEKLNKIRCGIRVDIKLLEDYMTVSAF